MTKTVNSQRLTVDGKKTPDSRPPTPAFKTVHLDRHSHNWQATDWIVVEKYSGRASSALYYARNLTLKEETPALGSKDDAWAVLLTAVKCYNNNIFIRATDAMRILQERPLGLSTVAFSKRWYHPERGHRGAKLKGGPRVPVVRKYLKGLAALGVVEHRKVTRNMLRWKVTPRGKAMLQLRKWWDQHRKVRGQSPEVRGQGTAKATA